MKQFAIDLGNSRIKWAVYENKKQLTAGAFEYRRRAWNKTLDKAWKEIDSIERVLVSNVAGDEYGAKLAGWLKEAWELDPVFAQSQKRACGITSAYLEPEQLGVDRWLSMVAARKLTRKAFCIIDCGTALTIDAVDHSGKHLGGLILPGLQTMRESLIKKTHAIEDSGSETRQGRFFARDTQSAVNIGTLYALLATCTSVVEDLKREVNRPVECFITGGDAELLSGFLGQDFTLKENLVLDGLVIANRK